MTCGAGWVTNLGSKSIGYGAQRGAWGGADRQVGRHGRALGGGVRAAGRCVAVLVQLVVDLKRARRWMPEGSKDINAVVGQLAAGQQTKWSSERASMRTGVERRSEPHDTTGFTVGSWRTNAHRVHFPGCPKNMPAPARRWARRLRGPPCASWRGRRGAHKAAGPHVAAGVQVGAIAHGHVRPGRHQAPEVQPLARERRQARPGPPRRARQQRGRVGGRAGLRRRQMPAAHAQVTAHVTSSSRPNLNPVLWKGRSACSRAGRAASGGGARAPAAVELGEVRAVLAHGRAALAAELLHHRLLLGRALANQLQQLVAPARGRIRVRARRTPLLTSHPWRCPCRARARACWRCGPRPACS